MVTVPERVSAHRHDLGRESAEGLGGVTAPLSQLHLPHAGGTCVGEKPVDLKITHRARSQWGVGVRAATHVLLRDTRDTRAGQTRSSEAREGEPACTQRGPMALVPPGECTARGHYPGRVGSLSHAVLAPTPAWPPTEAT